MSAKWTFWAWEVKIKTAPKKLALLQLANNANDDGKSWYAISKMADACGVAERTFQRQIQSLENDGLLQVERRSNRSSIYHLKDEMEITLKDTGDSLTPRGDAVTGQGDFVTPLGVTESHTILTIYPNNTPIKESNSAELDLNFEMFWLAGLVKVNKKKARSAFKIAAKGEKIDLFTAKLIGDIGRRLKANQFGFDKLHPERYLKNERWTDDIQTNSTPVNNTTESKPGWSAGTFDPNFLES